MKNTTKLKIIQWVTRVLKYKHPYTPLEYNKESFKIVRLWECITIPKDYLDMPKKEMEKIAKYEFFPKIRDYIECTHHNYKHTGRKVSCILRILIRKS